MAHAEAPIVFIHGIKGSTLLGPGGQVRWLTAAEGLGFTSYDLRLPMKWTGNTQARDGLTAGAPLRRITIIPKIFDEDIYGSWLDAQEKTHGAAFHTFAYDWRRDNTENAAAFEAFIDQLRAQNSNAKVRVVAHSMGGLITLSVMLRSPQKFESVVFAGVPFAGGIGFLKDMHVGASVGWNNSLLGPEILFTYPSVYTLFPEKGRGLIDPDNKLGYDFYEASTWTRCKLGIFANPNSDPARLEFLTWALDRARAFRASLHQKPAAKLPPVLVVSGKSHPTLVEAIHNGPVSVRNWDFTTAKPAAGDGRVAYDDSLPPNGVPYEKFETKSDHSNLLNDPAVIKKIDEFYAATAAKP